MNYESWISYRYFTAKKERFVSVISFVAMAGVSIGVMALIVVIGVMSGFDRDLQDKIIGTNAHIVIEKETGLKDFGSLSREIQAIQGITGTTPYIHGNVFLEAHGRALGLVLRGIDPQTETSVTKVADYLKQGNLHDLKEGSIILGSQLANYFGFDLGDEVTLISPVSGVAGEGWRYNLKVVGIFTSGMYDYDMNLVLVNLIQAQKIFNLGDGIVTGIAMKIKDVNEAVRLKETIYKALGYSYLVRTWIDSNRNFFAALQLEKFAMFVILTLIVLVASFSIVSTLIVTVTSKVKDIGILKSIGAPKRSIRRIFTSLGVAIGFWGTFWGVAGGVSVSLLLKKYQFIKLPQEIYYIDKLPVILELGDLLMIIGAAMLISYLATIYPAAKAANLEPVEALRYE